MKATVTIGLGAEVKAKLGKGSGLNARAGIAIKDNVSPAAVATIIAYLQPVKVKDKAVQREVEWFSEKLVEAVGGNAALNQLMDEVGL